MFSHTKWVQPGRCLDVVNVLVFPTDGLPPSQDGI